MRGPIADVTLRSPMSRRCEDFRFAFHLTPIELLRGELYIGIARGDVELVSQILIDVKKLVRPSDVLEDIAAHYPPSRSNRRPLTPLQMALMAPCILPDETGENRRRIVGLLLLAGARIDCDHDRYETPVELAVDQDRPKCLRELLRFGGASTDNERRYLLLRAVARSTSASRPLESAEILLCGRPLLTRKALQDTGCHPSISPLCLLFVQPGISTANRLGFLELYLRAGAIDVVDWENANGRRPIDLTIAGSPEEALLLSAGARPRGETLIID